MKNRIVLALLAIVAIAVIMVVVIPQFQSIFLGLLGPGEPLPLPTRRFSSRSQGRNSGSMGCVSDFHEMLNW